MLNKPNWNQWVDKEFIYAMQAKGKLPRPESVSRDTKEKVYYETMDRVFPARGEHDAIVDKMLADAEKKLAATSLNRPTDRKLHRNELKEHLKGLERLCRVEREATIKAENELRELQAARSNNAT